MSLSTQSWKANKTSGHNLVTPDVGEMSQTIRKMKLTYYFQQAIVHAIADAGLGTTAGVGLTDNIVIGKVSCSSVMEGNRRVNATNANEETSYFFVSSTATINVKRQWRACPQLRLLTGTDVAPFVTLVKSAYVNRIHVTLRFTNISSADTKEMFVYYKVMYPGEDISNFVSNATIADFGLPGQVISTFGAYPGMKRIRLGTNDANGGPNTRAVDVIIDVDKMREYWWKKLTAMSTETLKDADIPHWLSPRILSGVLAQTSGADDPSLIFWLCPVEDAAWVADNLAVKVEGVMVKEVTIHSNPKWQWTENVANLEAENVT